MLSDVTNVVSEKSIYNSIKYIIMKKLTLFFAILISLQLFAEPQHGVIYVVPNGAGTGASWSDALGNIQEAITLARTQDPLARKDVWVAGGEYEITTAINIMDSVNVYGSFAGTETAVSERARPENAKPWQFSNPTILRGNGSRLMQAGGHLDMETVIDGFTMQNGNGTGSALNNSGGAVVVRGKVVFQHCILRNNTSTGVSGVGSGGGAAIMTGGTIRHSLIENNTQTVGSNGGGGIFSNPPAGYPAYIENCVIRGNTTNIRGAGIGVQGGEKTYISNNEIYGNTAIDGTAPKPGAGIYSNSANNVVTNCLIYNNTGGTAVYYNGGNLYNNTIVKNVGGVYLAGNAINAINNIVWGCATDATGTTPTSITGVANSSWQVKNNATYNPVPTDKNWIIDQNIQFSSNVSNGDVPEPAPGTVGSGPKFTKTSNFIGVPVTAENIANLDSVNWTFNALSPCLNTGAPVDVVLIDFYGLNRPQGFPVAEAKYDIGAYELPYYTVVAGEAETANGTIYSKMGEPLAENFTQGFAKGSTLELYFEPAEGYKIGRAYYVMSNDGGLTFTGEEVEFLNELDQDLFWTTQVNVSFKVKVVWESLTALKNLNQSDIKCFSTGDGIQIQGIKSGDVIRVYNTTGMLVKELNASGEKTMIPLQQGMYVVRVAEGVQKVVVK